MPDPKTLVPIPGSHRHSRPGATEAGAPDPQERIRVSVLLRPRTPLAELAAGKALSAALPRERQYLSREEFAARFGADPADVQTLETYAHRHNLTVVEASLPRRTVVLSGALADLSAAFGVTLVNYKHPDGDFRGRTGPIFVPQELAGVVQAVFGFDNRRQARPHLRRPKVRAGSDRTPTGGYTPPQVAALYNYPSGLDGSGQCIGILEFGGGYRSSDLNAYFKQLGLPAPKVTAISVDGVQNQPMPGPDSPDDEVDLDIEVAGSIAPGAQLAVYFAPFTEQGWVDAINTAVNDDLHRPSVLSISWGFAEGQDIWSAQAIQAVDEAFQAAAAMGVTVCVASGDDGSRDQITDGLAHVDFPSSSEWVLACGGTSLQSSGTQIASEVVWNDGDQGGASGGGISDNIALPSWQAKAGVPPSVNPAGHVGRGVPDVAGNADPQTGYQVLSDGHKTILGGTSAVAPLWSALVALINQKLGKPVGFVNPILYGQPTVTAALRDVTSGSNDVEDLGGYFAGPGWDACTGFGSPNGTALVTALAGTPESSGSPG
ncbi:MAG TPA: S53 family peptidase [Terriglobia bacterium]|nr:S53 family peptidase [Terriglobia bacterium]